ncbi:hypothetical protein [Parvibaculum sp.]|uniref:hypothetical protein n=1 Tax=Parvibaculum sp. TaxID=2024848 RepID=UPI0034A07ED1
MRKTVTFPKDAAPIPVLVAALGAALIAAGLPVSPAARAQTPDRDMGVLCDELNYRFQFDFKYRKDFPDANEARALYRSGVEKCESGDAAAGAAELEEALAKIGVEPDRL